MILRALAERVNYTAQMMNTTNSGLMYDDLTEGTGAAATAGKKVEVHYTGWLYDPTKPESKGAQFDSQTSFTFQLGVGRVIAGWDQGVVGMKVGGQRRLVIPPNLGYGAQMVGSIPPNSTLVFDVMLLNVS